MSDTTQLIKERLDLVDFLKEYLKLAPAGKNYKALCPFHKEKTPSLMISPDRGVWHCFGCNVGGDLIKFLMLYENLEFYDALKILAEKAGVEMRAISNRDFHAHNNLYKALEAAKNFFKKELAASPEARKYFLERGLKEETIQEFELGLTTASSDALMKHLIKAGFNVADLEKAGLVLKTERGTFWDRFRSRLMFPIHNHFGKVVGFTGRILPTRPESIEGQRNPSTSSGWVAPKYINSPETPIFQKSKILYGFYKTKNDIRQKGAAVLVEGQMDFLMAWQDGVKNVVATSGTALGQDHLKALRRISDTLVIGFDGDEAGVAAAEKAADLAGAMDFNTRVLLLNGVKDPADLVQKEPGCLQGLVDSALPAMQYYFYKYINSLKGDQIAEKKRGIRTMLSKIAMLGSAVERSHWLKELAGLTGIEEAALIEEMDQVKVVETASVVDLKQQVDQENLSRKDLISQRIIGIVLNNQQLQDSIKPHLEYFPPLYQNVLAQDDLATFLSLRSSFEIPYLEGKDVDKELKELLKQLKKIFLKDQMQELRKDIDLAEKNGSEEKLTELLKKHRLVGQELQGL